MGEREDGLHALIAGYAPDVVLRGRTYALEERVRIDELDEDEVTATVRGTSLYRVHLADLLREPTAFCPCPAFTREAACKHVAAVAWVVGARAPVGRRPKPPRSDELPDVFAAVYSSATFFARLALYAGRPLADGRAEHWLPLAAWWRTGAGTALGRLAKEAAPEVERALETLRRWTPPAAEGFRGQLAALYLERRGAVEVRHWLPGPLDARHPGFVLSFDAERRLLLLKEDLRERPLALGVQVPLDPELPPAFLDNALASFGGAADAWELFALRALLLALEVRDHPAVVALDRELARAPWEYALDRLAKPVRPPETREWAFGIGGYWTTASPELTLVAWSRGAGKTTKWKKTPFDRLLDDTNTPLEREIGRIALAGFHHGNSAFVLGTAQAHELLRALADHPRVKVADRHGDPETAASVTDIVVGELSVHFDQDETGTLRPRFRAGGKDAPLTLATLGRTRGRPSRFVGEVVSSAGELRLCSAEVPDGLRPWLELAATMGDALRFPPEAVPRLANASQTLLARGTMQLPRDALGEEVPYAPRGAYRVTWQTDAETVEAVIDTLVEVHPRAPLAPAGEGPRLFGFELDGKRVFVERQLEGEPAVAEAARAALPACVEDGFTRGVEDTIALASFLEQNPLGLPIEVKVGKAPSFTTFANARTSLRVRRLDQWLRFEGAIRVQGASLTIGEVLEAARLAKRYVRASNGTFLELSKEALAKLQPIAIAAELSPDGDAVHEAFGSFIVEATELFLDTEDLRDYAKRFAQRARKVPAPRLEAGELRPYQAEGAAWMLRLASWAPGCVLADDMGLGKTVQTAALLRARKKKGPALIVAPASVTSNWALELARFVPSLRVCAIEDDPGPGDVVIVSYGLLQRQVKRYARRWSTVVLDEAQYVKNTGAQRSDAVRSLEKDFTIALTGTPLENHLGELFSIVDIVFPRLLGAEVTFRERFRRPIEMQKDGERLALLGRMIAPFLLRRTRRAVLEELPPREEITERIALSKDEQRRYAALREAVETDLRRRDREPSAQLRIALLAALTKLRQMACDVRLVDPSHEGPSTKVTRAIELVEQLAAEGNRALVFSQFTTFLATVRDGLVAAGLRVAYLTGETPVAKRQAIIDRFQRGEVDVFCISLLAGGTGLNLTRASYVLHLDPWWNPAVEEQATSRSHRMGQTEPVTVYRLVAQGTIEEAVLQMHATKRELAAAVLSGKDAATAFSSADLLDLLRFGAESRD